MEPLSVANGNCEDCIVTGWNLPPGCTDADIDRAMGGYDECHHEEFEINYEGRAECGQCGEKWLATADEIAFQREQHAEYDRWCRKEERREFWRNLTLPIRLRLHRVLARIWPRKSCAVLHDDEIPF